MSEMARSKSEIRESSSDEKNSRSETRPSRSSNVPRSASISAKPADSPGGPATPRGPRGPVSPCSPSGPRSAKYSAAPVPAPAPITPATSATTAILQRFPSNPSRSLSHTHTHARCKRLSEQAAQMVAHLYTPQIPHRQGDSHPARQPRAKAGAASRPARRLRCPATVIAPSSRPRT
jgi:hypothetical protein